ncbi:hypothetical protein CEUSTIGMA_g6197.t1 [Chlamydomonas eustigma]|uniref:PH domain-containing protein n=1 Tax=Chlamydomonas eustigma TaxID=1157962 RepID=A0A250X7M2_9CHLO|nr:hypothetical protein CEUSTIGMA_g6197.t1 [Chlamydomonas eustigma]|eukprot:GAX78760.1 hypothetical protein CEUSTIGMA_g6197.t1 [Chlamydomonas eustigma]
MSVFSNESDCLKSGWMYKMTRTSSEIFVKRKFDLFPSKFITFSDEHASHKNSWYLDKHCKLEPRDADEITQAFEKRERPKGKWTITTVIGHEGASIQLYMFEIEWPNSYLSKGYSHFTIASQSLDEIREWHGAIRNVIDSLAGKHVMHSPSLYKESSQIATGASPFAAVAFDEPEASDLAVNSSAVANEAASSASKLRNNEKVVVTYDGLKDDEGAESSEDDSDAEIDEKSFRATALRNRQSRLGERWVPYKQTNGVAVYHLAESAPLSTSPFSSMTSDNCGLGGEYMVSASIRGSPTEVLDVLLEGTANTTILGPASSVEVLQCDEDSDQKRTVMRLVLEAPGWAGRLCAAREVVVERLYKTEENVYVVLFSSVEDAQPSKGGHKLRSLYRRNVMSTVRGTYVIAPLLGQSLKSSKRTLITCIIKVDLKGVCGDNSWGRPFADLFGWKDAFLDRILMNVILVRDEVEHSCYVERPMADMLPTASHRFEDAKSLPVERQVSSSAPSGSPMVKRGSSLTLNRIRSRMFSRGGLPDISGITSKFVSDQANTDENDLPAVKEAAEPADEAVGSPLDLDKIQSLCYLESKYWSQIHAPGKDCPFSVRGPTYLKDKKKVPAGLAAFTFGAMDIFSIPEPVPHVARFLPSVRQSGAAFSVIINLIIPGNPMLGVVGTFMTTRHPDTLGSPPEDPMGEDHDWHPFDFVLHKFLNADDATRSKMLKLIPHIASGSWVVKQSVGTTPAIIGKALKTTYHVTKKYIEIDVDISANTVASYATGMCRGAAQSLVIDMGFVLEGSTPWELPECLLGALRLNHLEVGKAKPLNMEAEIPLS